MGNPSILRLIPAESASIPIDWSRVPEAMGKFLLDHYGYDWENEKHRPLPATIRDLVEMFDERKFLGYLDTDICTLLMDISEFGLAVQASGVPPRFYMEYHEHIWVVLFLPGKRDGIIAYSRNTVRRDDDDVSDGEKANRRMIAEELKAQEFDAKLVQQFSRGVADFVDITNSFCGWKALTFRKSLESAQFMTAMETLPISHPAYRAAVQSTLRSLGVWGSET